MSFWLLQMFFTVGLILGFNGVARLSAIKKTGVWREGGVSVLAGVIVGGVLPILWLVGFLSRLLQ